MHNKVLRHHFFIFFDADGSSAVVGGVLLAARVPADPWSREYKCLDLHERLPQIRPFLRNYRKLMNKPAQRRGDAFSDTEAGVQAAHRRDPKYGWFQLNERFNSDEALPYINGQSEAWPPREVSASPSRNLSTGWKRGSARSNLPLGRVGSSCGARSFFEAPGSGSRRWRRRPTTLALTFFSRKTRGLTARSAWRGLRSAFARVLSKGGVGCPRSNRC